MSAINASSTPIVFTAKWTPDNIHLKPKEQSLCARVWKAVKEFFSKIFNCIHRAITLRIVLPAAYCPKALKAYIHELWSNKWFGVPTSENALLRKNFTAIPLQLKTPTGHTITGAFYQAKAAQGKNIPTILCFGGNGSLFKRGGGEWLMNAAKDCPLPYNVVVFDYPSCGDSKGAINENMLVLGADTVYQCIKDQFNISEENIHTFGMSLGGGVSAQFLKTHPKAGRYINSHSFKSLKGMPMDTEMVDRFFYSQLPKCLKSCFSLEGSKKVASRCISKFFGDLNTLEALKHIKNRTMIIYHPDDPLIGEGNLGLVFDRVRQSNVEVVRLENNPAKNRGIPLNDHHNSSLSCYMDETGLPADKRALNFLLGKKVFKVESLPQRAAI